MTNLRGKSIPIDTREYPPYEFREYPKVLGYTPEGSTARDGAPVVANDAEHEAKLREQHPHLPKPGAPDSPTPPAPADMAAQMQALIEENRRLREKAGVPADASFDPNASDPWVAAETGSDRVEPSAGQEQPTGNKLAGKGKKK